MKSPQRLFALLAVLLAVLLASPSTSVQAAKASATATATAQAWDEDYDEDADYDEEELNSEDDDELADSDEDGDADDDDDEDEEASSDDDDDDESDDESDDDDDDDERSPVNDKLDAAHAASETALAVDREAEGKAGGVDRSARQELTGKELAKEVHVVTKVIQRATGPVWGLNSCLMGTRKQNGFLFGTKRIDPRSVPENPLFAIDIDDGRTEAERNEAATVAFDGLLAREDAYEEQCRAATRSLDYAAELPQADANHSRVTAHTAFAKVRQHVWFTPNPDKKLFTQCVSCVREADDKVLHEKVLTAAKLNEAPAEERAKFLFNWQAKWACMCVKRHQLLFWTKDFPTDTELPKCVAKVLDPGFIDGKVQKIVDQAALKFSASDNRGFPLRSIRGMVGRLLFSRWTYWRTMFHEGRKLQKKMLTKCGVKAFSNIETRTSQAIVAEKQSAEKARFAHLLDEQKHETGDTEPLKRLADQTAKQVMLSTGDAAAAGFDHQRVQRLLDHYAERHLDDGRPASSFVREEQYKDAKPDRIPDPEFRQIVTDQIDGSPATYGEILKEATNSETNGALNDWDMKYLGEDA